MRDKAGLQNGFSTDKSISNVKINKVQRLLKHWTWGYWSETCLFAIRDYYVYIDFSLTVKAVTLLFISGRGLANSSAKHGKSIKEMAQIIQQKEHCALHCTCFCK